MKKKFLLSLLAVLMCFILVGCSKSEEEKLADKALNIINESLNEFEESFDKESDNKKDNSKKEDNIENEIDIDLYSDDTKLVFNYMDLYTIVYYFEGDVITGLEIYYDYVTKEAATLAKSALEQGADATVEKVEQKGQYVILVYNESAYEDLTVEEIKTSYAYLEQVYEMEE